MSTEADKRIQLSSTKPDIKEISKNVKHCHSLYFFVLEKQSIFTFHKNIY